MTDFLEKGFFLGLGALALTREKAEQLVGELIEKGKISGEDSSQVLNDLMKRAEDEKKVLEDRFQKALEKAIQQTGLPTKKDIDGLNAKLDKVLAALEKE